MRIVAIVTFSIYATFLSEYSCAAKRQRRRDDDPFFLDILTPCDAGRFSRRNCDFDVPASTVLLNQISWSSRKTCRCVFYIPKVAGDYHQISAILEHFKGRGNYSNERRSFQGAAWTCGDRNYDCLTFDISGVNKAVGYVFTIYDQGRRISFTAEGYVRLSASACIQLTCNLVDDERSGNYWVVIPPRRETNSGTRLDNVTPPANVTTTKGYGPAPSPALEDERGHSRWTGIAVWLITLVVLITVLTITVAFAICYRRKLRRRLADSTKSADDSNKLSLLRACGTFYPAASNNGGLNHNWHAQQWSNDDFPPPPPPESFLTAEFPSVEMSNADDLPPPPPPQPNSNRVDLISDHRVHVSAAMAPVPTNWSLMNNKEEEEEVIYAFLRPESFLSQASHGAREETQVIYAQLALHENGNKSFSSFRSDPDEPKKHFTTWL